MIWRPSFNMFVGYGGSESNEPEHDRGEARLSADLLLLAANDKEEADKPSPKSISISRG